MPRVGLLHTVPALAGTFDAMLHGSDMQGSDAEIVHIVDAGLLAAAQAVDWSKVSVPFLSVGSLGTAGLHLRGNVEAFRHAASTQKWLMLLAARGPGIDRFYGDDGFAVQRRFLDHFLKGIDNGWETTPRVRAKIIDTANPLPLTGKSIEATTFPPQTSTRRLYFGHPLSETPTTSTLQYPQMEYTFREDR